MTAHDDLDQQLNALLRDGPVELPDRSFDAVRDRMEDTKQRVFIGPWRTPTMNKFVTYGLAAAAVVVAVLIGAQLLGQPDDDVGSPSSPSQGARSSAQPTPSSSAESFLPDGPILVFDPEADGAPSLTMTITASGWSHLGDLGALSKGTEVDNLPEAVVLPESLSPGAGLYVYGDPCHWQSTTPETAATTVDEIVAALAAQTSREASDPQDVLIDGYAGKWLTLHVPDDAAFEDCDGGEFGTYQLDAVAEKPARYHQGAGQVDDLWVVDVEGSIVIIDAMYRPDTPTETVAEMRDLAESTTFEAP